jgi:hypothetical protein
MVYIVHRNIRRLWSSTDDFPTLRFLNVSSQYSGRAMGAALLFRANPERIESIGDDEFA